MAGFLEAFSAKEVKRIERAGRRLKVPEGWSPISESTGADKLYVIRSGDVSVRRQGEEVARLGAGDVMGEKALLTGSLRTASLVALNELEVLHLTDEAVRELCEEMPKFRDELEKASRSH